MKKTLILLWAIALSLIPAVIFGEEEILTLEKTRELALQNSRSLEKYNLAVQSSVLDEKIQTFSVLPSLSLGASASVTLWSKDGVSGDLLRDSLKAGADISLSQTIYDGGKYPILKQINSLSSEIARQDALAEYYAVLADADAVYYGVAQAAAALEAAEISLETARLNLSTAEIRRTSGMSSDADYLQAQAEKESRELSSGQARRELSLALLKLKNLTGLTTISILEEPDFDSLEDFIAILAGMGEEGIKTLYSALREDIVQRNPGMVKAGLNSGKAEQNLNLAKRDYVPTFSASLSTGLSYSITNGFEPGSGQISLRGSIPLDFWVTAANVEKRQIVLEQASLDYQTTGASLDMEIQTSILDLVSQAGQVLSARRALDYAQKNYEYTAELFGLSRISLSELSDAESLVHNNRNALIKAQYGVLSSLSKIRSAGVFESEAYIIDLVMNTVRV
jgi:multidrug efflux system outer membrane protein